MLGKIFSRTLGLTLGVAIAVGMIGGGAWWYFEKRAPNIDVQFAGFGDLQREGKNYWILRFVIMNNESQDFRIDNMSYYFVRDGGNVIPHAFKLGTLLDETIILLANETSLVSLVSGFTVDDEPLFAPDFSDWSKNGSREDAESYLGNLEHFREEFKNEFIILANEKIRLRQKVSLAEYYEEELARRQSIVEQKIKQDLGSAE